MHWTDHLNRMAGKRHITRRQIRDAIERPVYAVGRKKAQLLHRDGVTVVVRDSGIITAFRQTRRKFWTKLDRARQLAEKQYIAGVAKW